jgi:hypothetical protein
MVVTITATASKNEVPPVFNLRVDA